MNLNCITLGQGERKPFPSSARLVVAALLIGAISQTTQAQTSVIYLPGQIRDFRKAHPDFDVPPGPAYDHIAGNIELSLPASGLPGHGPGGFAVSSQWRNSSVDPIAPHLYVPLGLIKLVNIPAINGNPTVDTFDSSLGPYGGANVGPVPSFETGSTMPKIPPPTGLPPLIDEVIYDGLGMSTLSSNVNCDRFRIQNNHTVTISGDVVIRANEEFRINNLATLIIPDGSTLTVYARDKIEFTNNVNINMSSPDHSRLVIYYLGTQEVKLWNNASIYAQIISPNAQIHAQGDTDFYGTFVGLSMQMDNNSGFHLATQPPLDQCGTAIADSPGISGGANNAAITSAATFDQWFSDQLGTNLTTVYMLRLVRNVAGVYVLSESAFLPIDDLLFGNEGDLHNYNFTYSAEFSFVYNACTNQYFEFSGSDDLYLFIDGKLAIDLGGIMNGQRQVIELDRLELTDGETYSGAMFFANRHAGSSSLNIETTVELIPRMLLPVSSAGYD